MSDFSLISQLETNKIIYSDNPTLSSYPLDYRTTPGLIAQPNFYLLSPMNPDSHEDKLYNSEKELNIVEQSKKLEAPEKTLLMIGQGFNSDTVNKLNSETSPASSSLQTTNDNGKVLSNFEILEAMKKKATLFVTSEDKKVAKNEKKANKRKKLENEIKTKKLKTAPPKYFSFKD